MNGKKTLKRKKNITNSGRGCLSASIKPYLTVCFVSQDDSYNGEILSKYQYTDQPIGAILSFKPFPLCPF